MTKTVLIVEDNDKNMKLARDVLRHQGYATLEARTGEQALQLAVDKLPDLVMMDIQLPDIGGIEVLQRIRTHAALDAVPVLAVSASVMPEDRRHIDSSGFDAYLTKPIALKPFLAEVERLLKEGRKK